jgi:hypothetical protein
VIRRSTRETFRTAGTAPARGSFASVRRERIFINQTSTTDVGVSRCLRTAMVVYGQ